MRTLWSEAGNPSPQPQMQYSAMRDGARQDGQPGGIYCANETTCRSHKESSLISSWQNQITWNPKIGVPPNHQKLKPRREYCDMQYCNCGFANALYPTTTNSPPAQMRFPKLRASVTNWRWQIVHTPQLRSPALEEPILTSVIQPCKCPPDLHSTTSKQNERCRACSLILQCE